MQGSTYTQPRHKDEVGWLVLRSAAFTPGEITRYSFYRRLSGPQGQSGHEGMKKNLHVFIIVGQRNLNEVESVIVGVTEGIRLVNQNA